MGGTYERRDHGHIGYEQNFHPAPRTRSTSNSGRGETWNAPRPMDAGDPYNPQIVYDLLSGKNEWKNIQDIVKITFKAVCDTVKVQG